MTCQARVLNQELTFPNSDVTFHTTKECGENATHKYSVDGGDASMSICGDCLRRCLTKKSPGSTWCGFFDCDYPPDAKVKGSRWYFWQLRSAPASAPQEEEQEQEEEEEEEEESEVFEITISGKKYYTNNNVNGKIYSIDKDEEVGDEIGVFVNSKPKFNM